MSGFPVMTFCVAMGLLFVANTFSRCSKTDPIQNFLIEGGKAFEKGFRYSIYMIIGLFALSLIIKIVIL